MVAAATFAQRLFTATHAHATLDILYSKMDIHALVMIRISQSTLT